MNYPLTAPVIGVIGGGQLARMMAPAATNLGFNLHVLAEAEDVSAVSAVANSPIGDYKDLETVRAFARGKDVITFDHEHVPAPILQALLEDGVNLQPRPQALIYAQDKLEMRRAIDRLGLPNPRWAEVTNLDELLAFGEEIGWPLVLKTPRGGYDGKGVMVLDDVAEAKSKASAWFTGLAEQSFSSLLVEEKVAFSRELSALVARRDSGQVMSWPVAESIQVNSVCDEVIAPAPNLSDQVAQAATTAAQKIASQLEVTGVMAVELFEVPGSEQGYLVNELAMRPHNSGHWTQDGSTTSQFEQHLRAVLDLPLGQADVKDQVALMKNYLGGSNENLFAVYQEALAAEPRAKIHMYGKSVRLGRKIGHVNMSGKLDELENMRASASRVAQILSEGSASSSN